MTNARDPGSTRLRPDPLVVTLRRVLRLKIGITIVAWAGPLVLLPGPVLDTLGVPMAALPILRLLGWAYVALCVGYAHGLRELRAGRPAPRVVLVVGIVSNGMAGSHLAYSVVSGAWTAWPAGSALVAGGSACIALGLAAALFWCLWQGDRRAVSEAADRAARPRTVAPSS